MIFGDNFGDIDVNCSLSVWLIMESPNLNQTYIMGCSQQVLETGVIDSEMQGNSVTLVYCMATKWNSRWSCIFSEEMEEQMASHMTIDFEMPAGKTRLGIITVSGLRLPGAQWAFNSFYS